MTREKRNTIHSSLILAKKKAAVASVVAAVGSFMKMSTAATSNAAYVAVTPTFDSKVKPKGRYLRNGALPRKNASVWVKVKLYGDELEFFHFLSLSRKSFTDLCKITSTTIERSPLHRDYGIPRSCDLRRRIFDPCDIMAMAIKFLLSMAESKDLHVQFGAIASSFRDMVEVGCAAIIKGLINNTLAQVYWDRSEEGLKRVSDMTKMFSDIPGVVGMIDGKKLESFHPSNHLEQNRDYNGWHSTVNRNMVLLWDPRGKFFDAGINLPGNFHDSKGTLWCHIYDHIAALPEGYVVVCDSAFNTGGNLKGKLVKLKEAPTGDEEIAQEKSDYEKSLTHLRQCSEWGNNVLTGVFRRLRTKLPTDNVKRATIQWCCILLHNWRTETCDRNQIKTYFNNLNQSDNV